MKLVRQPYGSNLCGQACVATLSGTTLDSVIQLMNKRGKTVTRDLKLALNSLGIKTERRRTLGMPDKETTALLFWKSPDNKERHWTVWFKGKHYDPAAGVFRKVPKHLEDAKSRVTSHLVVELI